MGGSQELAALARLEELVGRAAEQLKSQRAENQKLRERLRGLESADGEGTSAKGDRAELIARVERLVGGLDEVLSLTARD